MWDFENWGFAVTVAMYEMYHTRSILICFLYAAYYDREWSNEVVSIQNFRFDSDKLFQASYIISSNTAESDKTVIRNILQSFEGFLWLVSALKEYCLSKCKVCERERESALGTTWRGYVVAVFCICSWIIIYMSIG